MLLNLLPCRTRLSFSLGEKTQALKAVILTASTQPTPCSQSGTKGKGIPPADTTQVEASSPLHWNGPGHRPLPRCRHTADTPSAVCTYQPFCPAWAACHRKRETLTWARGRLFSAWALGITHPQATSERLDKWEDVDSADIYEEAGDSVNSQTPRCQSQSLTH